MYRDFLLWPWVLKMYFIHFEWNTYRRPMITLWNLLWDEAGYLTKSYCAHTYPIRMKSLQSTNWVYFFAILFGVCLIFLNILTIFLMLFRNKIILLFCVYIFIFYFIWIGFKIEVFKYWAVAYLFFNFLCNLTYFLRWKRWFHALFYALFLHKIFMNLLKSIFIGIWLIIVDFGKRTCFF